MLKTPPFAPGWGAKSAPFYRRCNVVVTSFFGRSFAVPQNGVFWAANRVNFETTSIHLERKNGHKKRVPGRTLFSLSGKKAGQDVAAVSVL